MRPSMHHWLILAFAFMTVCACTRDESVNCDGDPPEIERPDFWTQESHCRGVLPNYDQVFDDEVLHEFRIVISPDDYENMMDDMDEKFGGTTTLLDLDELPNPIWVPVDITYNGELWTKVGMRWKGHSSLKAAWQTGIRKLSFLLMFDYFEESNPNLLNQRFYGFKKFSFSNGYNDPSLIREKVAYEVYRAAGVPVPRLAFATVYFDWGEGEEYLGLYTMIEDPADEMLLEQFGDDTGNLYKPWGNAARWLSPDVSYSWLGEANEDGEWEDGDWEGNDWEVDIESHFEKCTNDDYPDWTDIESVIKRLHRDRNVPEYWRTELEEVFDVQSFIKALAIGRVMMNWDAYGCMHHNYYVYANPLDFGRFVWLPWDMNEAMLDREQAHCLDNGSVMMNELVYADDDAEIDTDWPLVQFILADSKYRADYKRELQSTIDGPFAIDDVHSLMDKYNALIAPWVIGPEETEVYPYSNTTSAGFENSLEGIESSLKPHVVNRHSAVNDALGN